MNVEQVAEINAAIDQLKRVFVVLVADLDEAQAYGREKPTPYAHRAAIRAYLILVEGIRSKLIEIALLYARGDAKLLSSDQVKALEGKKRLGFAEGMANAMICYAKVRQIPFTLDRGLGWDAMCALVEKRNRLTHPETVSQLDVEDEHREQSQLAASWFEEQMSNLLPPARAHPREKQ